MIHTKWNKKFQTDSVDLTSSLNRMNIGTSYFVAPNNITNDPDTIRVTQSNQSNVLNDLSKILKRYETEEAEQTKNVSVEALAQRKAKRPQGIRKVEMLVDRISANVSGALINGREMRKPSANIAIKIANYSPHRR